MSLDSLNPGQNAKTSKQGENLLRTASCTRLDFGFSNCSLIVGECLLRTTAVSFASSFSLLPSSFGGSFLSCSLIRPVVYRQHGNTRGGCLLHREFRSWCFECKDLSIDALSSSSLPIIIFLVDPHSCSSEMLYRHKSITDTDRCRCARSLVTRQWDMGEDCRSFYTGDIERVYC